MGGARTVRLADPAVGHELDELARELAAERRRAGHELPYGAQVVLLHCGMFAEEHDHGWNEAVNR